MYHNDKNKIINNNKLPKSIRSVVKRYPSNQVNRLYYGGLPHIGNALWGSWNSQEVKEAAEAYENYSLSDNLLITGFDPPEIKKIRLGGGSPARFKPFNPCIKEIEKTVKNKTLSDYPMAAGDVEHKTNIIEYFKKNNIKNINENNIIFTHSSTQAFTLIMEAILDYGDVVIMTSPNYGLFSFIPERTGGKVRFLKLEKINDWKIDPRKLSKLILEINKELKSDYDMNRQKYIFRRSDIAPRVVAFVNINPHNPLGTVYGEKEKNILSEIAKTCKESGVFIIDDLVYSGLEFNKKNLAIPMCLLKENFDNTITIYSLSKSYGLASLRSGVIICNEIISSLIRDRIFQNSDSLSVIQSSAMSVIFSNKAQIKKERSKYFSYIAKEYYERYIFVKGIIKGKDSISKKENLLLSKILKKNKINNIENLFSGIKDIDIITEPQSGFFLLLDMSKLLGKKYKGFKICNEKSLLQFLYTSNNVKALTGKAFCWPNNNQLIIRVTTALEYKDLLESFLKLKNSIESLS